MEVLGYFGAVLIGLVLGLTGGGGSLLTVPILVYLLSISPITATSYSLFIVGITSFFGIIQNHNKGNVVYKKGILFAIPSLIGVFITRAFILPKIPSVLINWKNYTVDKNTFLLFFFATIMLLASYSMLKSQKSNTKIVSNFQFIVQNFVIGIIIGLVGAGGGFLIIPSLVIFGHFSIRKAIGTSLFIITLNSLIGFLGDLSNVDIDWNFLLIFTSFSIIGIFLGTYLSKYISDKKLKKGFAYLVLFLGFFILTKQIIHILSL